MPLCGGMSILRYHNKHWSRVNQDGENLTEFRQFIIDIPYLVIASRTAFSSLLRPPSFTNLYKTGWERISDGAKQHIQYGKHESLVGQLTHFSTSASLGPAEFVLFYWL